MFQPKWFRENQNKHLMFNNSFFSAESRAVYEITWRRMVEPDRPGDNNKIRRMRFACWITKATDAHSEYKILTAFPRQQRLHKRASMLRLYVHSLYC